ncbi:hypothetical protein TCAL_16437 [Tigriopus californicus]|uniref:Uncharacterized protein n=1 Tax=Tigriopus californicus TaxID=6832 RepID=A0A553P0D2_TIGCA|nr:hypothetical protein TCAL_16437 [Tigriopus californicus]
MGGGGGGGDGGDSGGVGRRRALNGSVHPIALHSMSSRSNEERKNEDRRPHPSHSLTHSHGCSSGSSSLRVLLASLLLWLLQNTIPDPSLLLRNLNIQGELERTGQKDDSEREKERGMSYLFLMHMPLEWREEGADQRSVHTTHDEQDTARVAEREREREKESERETQENSTWSTRTKFNTCAGMVAMVVLVSVAHNSVSPRNRETRREQGERETEKLKNSRTKKEKEDEEKKEEKEADYEEFEEEDKKNKTRELYKKMGKQATAIPPPPSSPPPPPVPSTSAVLQCCCLKKSRVLWS